MPGRKVYDERDARTLLDAVDRSGQGLAGWCRASGVDGRSLNMWRQNLARRGERTQRADGVQLVELVVQGHRAAAAVAAFRISHGAFTVAFDADVDAEVLRRVLWAVSTC